MKAQDINVSKLSIESLLAITKFYRKRAGNAFIHSTYDWKSLPGEQERFLEYAHAFAEKVRECEEEIENRIGLVKPNA